MSKKETRIDPRVLRTRKLMRQSLIELVPQKGFGNLTIEDITSQATLNRATFYLHYRDKEELLMDVFENLVSENIPLPPTPSESAPLESLRPIVRVFEHIADYSEFYCAILGEHGVPIFMAKVRNYIEEIVEQWMKAFMQVNFDEEDQGLSDILFNFLGSAYLGVITWWLENDMPYTPEEMETHLLKMTNKGISSLLMQ